MTRGNRRSIRTCGSEQRRKWIYDFLTKKKT